MQMRLKCELELLAIDDSTRAEAVGVAGYLVVDVAGLEGWLADALTAFRARQPPEQAPARLTVLPGHGDVQLRRTGRRGDLTRREIEVLALVADGMSNTAIAERLFLSRRTVEKHVEHLLAKTGTQNRAQLVSFALRAHAS